MAPNPITTVTRTVSVAFDQDNVRALLREKCGAPEHAAVEIETWGDATVTWSETEQIAAVITKRGA